MVVLAAELLKRSKPFIEDGVHPQMLIRAYSKAAQEVPFYLIQQLLNYVVNVALFRV